ncbi:MAG: CCA tRNA nucleotidyltransferase [Thaumarchaeota archaeon]|nr:CCA tRNA nucleotidyltransferase [Nitrososphaerota archaeon]
MSKTASSLENVLSRASKLVTPSLLEIKKLQEVALNVSALIKEALDKESADPRPEIVLGGSYARGTWLKGSHDIDFFLLYPVEFSREKLESVAIRSISEAVKGYEVNLRYAEHPYVEAFVDNVRVNLVPCYKVTQGEWRSAADRSPFHTKYIASKLDEKLKLEARLFKKFVKATGVYGAEVKVQGFSGYVCEVLIIWKGSFVGVLQALSRIRPGEVISLESYDKDLAASFQSPLVVLDPVDTTRNLGTAISPRNVAKLVLQSRRFLSNPALSFFLSKKIKKPTLNSKTRELFSNLLVVSFNNEKRSPDIRWGQLRRSVDAISDKLSRFGFLVLRSRAASDEQTHSALLFLLADDKLGKLHSRKGPEYYRESEVSSYYSKNKARAILTWIGEDGRIESIFERDSTSAPKYLEKLLSRERLDSVGLSEEIKKEIRKNHRISVGLKILKSSRGDWLDNEIIALVTDE